MKLIKSKKGGGGLRCLRRKRDFIFFMFVKSLHGKKIKKR